jgi:hypothetical protein
MRNTLLEKGEEKLFKNFYYRTIEGKKLFLLLIGIFHHIKYTSSKAKRDYSIHGEKAHSVKISRGQKEATF